MIIRLTVSTKIKINKKALNWQRSLWLYKARKKEQKKNAYNEAKIAPTTLIIFFQADDLIAKQCLHNKDLHVILMVLVVLSTDIRSI